MDIRFRIITYRTHVSLDVPSTGTEECGRLTSDLRMRIFEGAESFEGMREKPASDRSLSRILDHRTSAATCVHTEKVGAWRSCWDPYDRASGAHIFPSAHPSSPTSFLPTSSFSIFHRPSSTSRFATPACSSFSCLPTEYCCCSSVRT